LRRPIRLSRISVDQFFAFRSITINVEAPPRGKEGKGEIVGSYGRLDASLHRRFT
jgi:hypothetical protein